jgi:outer membrane biosynthesis protein TonB
MRRISIFALNLIALALVAFPFDAGAAEPKVNVRGGVHDGYTRIVLDGAATKGYQAIEKSGSLTLTFKSAADFSVASPAPASLARIGGFSSTPTSVTILYSRELNMRHFAAGNRLIVDIKGPIPKKEPAKAEPKKDEAKKEDKPAEEKKADVKPEVKAEPKAEEKQVEKAEEPKPAPKEEAKVEPEKSAEAAKPADPAPATAATPDKFDAHMISITATQATGLAAFVRGRTLWLVFPRRFSIRADQASGLPNHGLALGSVEKKRSSCSATFCPVGLF